MAQMVTEAERGLAVRTNATAGQLLEAWFEHAAPDFSPKTVKETRGFIDRNLLPALGEVPLSKLRPSDLDRLYRRLQRQGAVDGGPLAPASVRRIHGILRRALGQGVRWGWRGVNLSGHDPVTGMTLGRELVDRFTADGSVIASLRHP